MKKYNNFVCVACDGTNKIKESYKQFNGSMSKWYDVQCTCDGDKSDDIFLSLVEFLKAIHTCEKEIKNEKCKGCEYEREEILNYVWHYGKKLVNEHSNK